MFHLSAWEAAAYLCLVRKSTKYSAVCLLLLAAPSDPSNGGSAKTESSCKMGTASVAAECSYLLWNPTTDRENSLMQSSASGYLGTDVKPCEPTAPSL